MLVHKQALALGWPEDQAGATRGPRGSTMLLPHNAMVAVADGHGMTVFRNAGTDAAPRLEQQPSPLLSGGVPGSGTRHRSSTANPDDGRLEDDAYAASVVNWLNGEAIAGRIEHLAIVATPKSLGEMRLHYHGELRKRLLTEVPKEMTAASSAAVVALIAAAR